MGNKIGRVSNTHMSDSETETFLKIIESQRGLDAVKVLHYIIQDQDLLLLILDALAGETMRIPSREETIKMIEYSQIWETYKRTTGEPLERARETALIHKRRTQSIQRIIQKVEELIGGEDKCPKRQG